MLVIIVLGGGAAAFDPAKLPYDRFNLARPLAEDDVTLYRQIFDVQAKGDFDQAADLIDDLDDTRLLGHLLYQRYMHPDYISSFDELRHWLIHYNHQPGADDIYTLALRKSDDAAEEDTLIEPGYLDKIALVREPTIEWGKQYRPKERKNAQARKDVFAVERLILSKIRKNHLSHALELLRTDPRAQIMDQAQKDILRAQIAVGFYYHGDLDKAAKIAQDTLKSSGDIVPLSSWVMGLISWREGFYKKAAGHFENAASSDYASGWMAAAGGFWAARAHMKTANYEKVSPWLMMSYAHPRTFYGLLATRALGKDFEFNWRRPGFTQAHQATLAAIPAGARAKALLRVGRRDLAELELMHINMQDDPAIAQALLAFALDRGFPRLAVRLGSRLTTGDGFYDSALYPESPWRPKSGYRLDPALLKAIMRQESHFTPDAVSPSGAVGLMQIMPTTARYVGLSDTEALSRPDVNLDVAQAYIERLLAHPAVGGDILKMIVAYNAGPGNLQKWLDEMGDIDDPLLFIESIPINETRAYVERVLSNYWIYQRRAGLQTPSLAELAQGQWISYEDMQKIQPFRSAEN